VNQKRLRWKASNTFACPVTGMPMPRSGVRDDVRQRLGHGHPGRARGGGVVADDLAGQVVQRRQPWVELAVCGDRGERVLQIVGSHGHRGAQLGFAGLRRGGCGSVTESELRSHGFLPSVRCGELGQPPASGIHCGRVNTFPQLRGVAARPALRSAQVR
jgi:hypothetical protein